MEHKPENYTLVHAYEQALQPPQEQKISSVIEENLALFRQVLRLSPDLVIREFHIARKRQFRAALIYFDELINKTDIHDFVLKALMLEVEIARTEGKKPPPKPPTGKEAQILRRAYQNYTGKKPALKKHPSGEPVITRANIAEYVEKYLLPTGQVKPIEGFWETLEIVLSGQSILLIDGSPHAYITDMQGWEKRGVPDAVREASVLGPNDAFNETLMVNLALIRRRLRDPRLAIKMHKVGVRTRTDVAIVYVDGLANPSILNEIETAIDNIRVDGLLHSRALIDFLTQHPYNIFPIFQTTERPDKAAAAILQGQFAIVADNAPGVILAPSVMSSFFHSVDDYLFSPLVTAFIRIIRTMGWVLTLFAPALYVALSSVSTDTLAPELLLSVSRSREGVPYPPWVETIFLGLMIELLIESSARLPGTIGPTATTVGGLIIGQAAAQAQLISNLMIIVASATVIGSFALPNYELALAWRISQAILIPFAALFGLFGIVIGLCFIIAYLCSLESFGVPYLSPLGPLRIRDAARDVWLRYPWKLMLDRPSFTQSLDRERQPD